jgi:type III pantothenate kinase
MFLIGDLGNTHSKFTLCNLKSKKIKNYKSFNTNNILTNKNFIKFISKHKIKYAVVTSVVPKVSNKLKFLLQKKNIRFYEILDKIFKKPIKLKVTKPSQVGSDRVANSIAAFTIYKTNCIIVDFGTATTFDILSKKGFYLGGLITPGVKLTLQTLNQFTEKLPLINLKKTNQVIGKDTISAINSGIYWGYIGMINQIINKIISTTKKKYKVILTGGLSTIFSNSLVHKASIDKNITLQGVLELINFNKHLFK